MRLGVGPCLPLPRTAGVRAAGISGTSRSIAMAPVSEFYREARLSAGKLKKFTQRSSWPPPATVSLQSTQGKSITARQGDGNWRGAALSPPRTRKRTNSPRPGLCPTISKVFTERAVCARRIPQGVSISIVSRSFEFAGWFLRQFPQNHVECIARAAQAIRGRDRKRDPRRENRRPFAPRRHGLAPSTAFESRLRMREQRLRHGEQGGAAASRKLTLEGKLGTVFFGGVPLGVAKGNRRFASRTVLPLQLNADEHRLPFIDFGHTPLFSPRDGLAKGKKSARCRRHGIPSGPFSPFRRSPQFRFLPLVRKVSKNKVLQDRGL